MKNVYSKRRTVPLRRKREGKTDYHLRLGLLKSQKPRLVIRKTLHHTIAQLVEYCAAGDKIIVSAHSRELKSHGYSQSTGNLPAAYLTGALLAKKAKEAKVKEAVLDLGLQTKNKGGKLYAALKGAVDAGLDVHHSKEILPSDERVCGNHISHSKADAVKAEFEKAKGALL